MSKIGGPTGPQSTQPTTSTDSSSPQETKSTQATETPSSAEAARASEDHAKSKASEQRLEGSVRQSQLQQSLPQSAPASPGQSAPMTNIDGQQRVTPGPANPVTVDVTKEPAFQALPEAARKQLVKDMNNPAESDRLQKVVNHNLYNQMTTEQKTKLLNVFANTGPKGRDGLAVLMNREVVVGSGSPPPTAPALLTGDNMKGQTSLLEHLNKMTDQPLHSSLANRRKELLADVIQQTGEPSWHLDQGVTGTCAPTTVQQHVLQHSPAEYARIVSGLSGPDRSVVLANGQKMDAAKNQEGNMVATGTPATLGKDPRSVTERMFQSAVQQHGDRITNPAYTFDANTDNTGLWDNQTAHVMSGIYNRKYEFHPPGAKGINNATNDVPTRNTMRATMYGQVENEINSHQGPVAVHLVWGGTDPTGKAHGLHEVLVEKIEGGRVYFRNPWGSRAAQGQNYTDGSNIAGPPARKVEDSQSGLESMPAAQFQGVLNGAVVGPPVGGQ